MKTKLEATLCLIQRFLKNLGKLTIRITHDSKGVERANARGIPDFLHVPGLIYHGRITYEGETCEIKVKCSSDKRFILIGVPCGTKKEGGTGEATLVLVDIHDFVEIGSRQRMVPEMA